MGKTVKSRLFMSITAVVCVILFCVIANTSIPAIYESHAEKVAAQDAATRTSQKVEVPTTTTTTAPVTEPETSVTEDSEVYEIVEEETTTVTTTEPTTEEVTEEETTTEAPSSSGEEGILDKIINFFTSIIDAIFSGDIISLITDFFSEILGIFGL